jgi:Rhs element Vgr protein
MSLLDTLPPSTSKNTGTVAQKVFIEGTVLSKEILLSQITVSKSFNKISYAKITFLDGSASKRDFELSNDDKFKPGNKIKIQLGYNGNTDTVFEGIIIKHAIKVMQSGSSILIIEAKDKAILMTASRKSAYHINKTDSVVITKIAHDNSITNTDIDSTDYTHPQLMQMDATDWDFIVSRAEANAMLVITDDGKLIVKKPSADAAPIVTVTYGQDILEFEAEMDARRQFNSVTSRSWDYTKQKLEDPVKGKSSFSENGDLASEKIAQALAADINLIHSGDLTKDQLTPWANAYALRSKISKAAGRVRIQGNADVKPGTIVKLKGVGNRFNGNVFVTGILHHYEGGWQTDVQFGWREEWFYKVEDFMNRPAAGLLPGINGLQIGIVLDVKDDGQYRVKVHIPTITSGNEGLWARVATIDAGQNRGSYFRPQTGDEVVLGFLNDDPRDAIIIGYLHSKDKKAIPFADANAQEYGFVTKDGMKLSFDDKNKRVTLLAKTDTGEKSITLNNSSKAIELKDENGNSIIMDATGITIKADKIITIKGQTVMIN